MQQAKVKAAAGMSIMGTVGRFF